MKQKLLEMIEVKVWLHTDHLFLFLNAKTVLLRRPGATTKCPGYTRTVGGRRGLS